MYKPATCVPRPQRSVSGDRLSTKSVCVRHDKERRVQKHPSKGEEKEKTIDRSKEL